MAENKKSFILYADLLSMVERLPKEKAGELFVMILEYVNDKHPKTDDLLLQIAFEPIKLQLKRDLKQWVDKIEDKSRSGRIGNLKRWHNDLYVQVLDFQLTLEEAEFIAKSRKVSHTDEVPSQSIANVAVTVNDTVTVTDTVIVIEEQKQDVVSCFSFDEFWNVYDKKTGKEKCISLYSKISEKDRAIIKSNLPNYINSIIDKKFQKNPQTYLFGKCWNDEIYSAKVNSTEQTSQTNDEIVWQKLLDLAKIYKVPQDHLINFYPNGYNQLLEICESGKIPKR